MAIHTDIALRSQIIYSVYLRNHPEDGTFRALIPDLDRIQALGTDIIWLMPIHPIGVKGKKGSLGCPYANRDYRTVNPAYGTMEDFAALVDAIHAKGMKCIIDVVYNHTSPDSTLTVEHPEFFYRKPDGNMGNRVGEWTDVVDLDYNIPALWDYQIESLQMWAKIVDGFRCDVASLIPLEFWQRARKAVAQVNPSCIWLAESVHTGFALTMRLEGLQAWNDYELFSAFDMEYDYDIREVLDRYLEGTAHLSNYTDMLNFQEGCYPINYDKMRCLENHDQKRICHFLRSSLEQDNFTAMLYFLKGTTLLYAGQEYSCTHTPSLFEKEVFPRSGRDISLLLQKLAQVKKEILSPADAFQAQAEDEHHIAILTRTNKTAKKLGIFSLKGLAATVAVPFPDGIYENKLTGEPVSVEHGLLHCSGAPMVLTTGN